MGVVLYYVRTLVGRFTPEPLNYASIWSGQDNYRQGKKMEIKEKKINDTTEQKKIADLS